MPEHVTRLSIARAFLRGLATLGRAVRPRPPLAVPAHVYDFTEIIAGSPAMVEALAEPRVLRMLRGSPSTLAELAALLRLAADAPAPDPDSPAVN